VALVAHKVVVLELDQPEMVVLVVVLVVMLDLAVQEHQAKEIMAGQLLPEQMDRVVVLAVAVLVPLEEVEQPIILLIHLPEQMEAQGHHLP
jgi:hypothetical protein